MPLRLTFYADPKFPPPVESKSRDRDLPSLIRQKRSGVTVVDKREVDTRATASATCEKCGRTRVKYSMVQLRSADEGSTVFYNCECGHKLVLSFKSSGLLLTLLDSWNENS